MINYKSFFKSKTLIGLVVAAIPTVAGWAGVTITPADASEATTQITSFAENAVEMFGWALAFYGRVFATKALTS